MTRLFLSVAGPDRDRVRELVAALRRRRVDVFTDETGIAVGQGVTPAIQEALSGATALVAYYSRAFTSRPACQLELIAAYLAGQREGDPARRVIVVNPHLETDHLHPAALSDAAFVADLPGTDVDVVARRIVERATRLDGTIGDTGPVRYGCRPQWYGRGVAGTPEFVGRYPLLWRLHTALSATDFAMTQEPTHGPVAVLSGVPGAGKTTAVAEYAWLFGDAYPGGVHWISLARLGDVHEVHADEVRAAAGRLGLDVTRLDDVAVRGAVVDEIRSRGPALWVTDDVPDGVSAEDLRKLVLEGASCVRTVLVSRHAVDGVGTQITLGALTADEGRAVLGLFRPVPGGGSAAARLERAACDEIVERVGGHPLALRVLGALLTGTEPLLSYRELAERLPRDVGALDAATGRIAASVVDLGPVERLVLEVAAVCAPTAVPVRVLARAVAALGHRHADDTSHALRELARRELAKVDGAGAWRVHPLVTAGVSPGEHTAAAAAAAVVAEVTSTPDAHERNRPLTPHATALAGLPDGVVPGAEVESLWRFLAAWYTAEGAAVGAAEAWRQVCRRSADAPADVVATARALHTAGRYGDAVSLAERVQSAAGADEAQRFRAAVIQAESLDSLGVPEAAEPVWRRLSSGSPEAFSAPANLPPPEAARLRLAHVRHLRMRGPMREAVAEARRLVADARLGADSEAAEEQQIARIELARLQLYTDAQGEARRTARDVVDHYERLGTPRHVRAMEAREVLAEARVTLHLTELHPDPADWSRAERELAEIVEENTAAYGVANPITLTTRVLHGYAMVSCGRPWAVRPELTATRAEVGRRLGTRHPLWLRATFYLGQAAAQRQELEVAVDLYRTAYDGQVTVLGPVHPDTLHSQYALGVGLVMTGRRSEGVAHLNAVSRNAPRSVGRITDLNAQAKIAQLMTLLPGSLWRWVAGATALKQDRPPPV